jgi:hypothetical protein
MDGCILFICQGREGLLAGEGRGGWQQSGAGWLSNSPTFDRAPKIFLAALIGVSAKLIWSEWPKSEAGWPR